MINIHEIQSLLYGSDTTKKSSYLIMKFLFKSIYDLEIINQALCLILVRRNCLYYLTRSSFISISSKSAIFSRHATSGCEVFVHHLLTVEGVTPNCSESHRE